MKSYPEVHCCPNCGRTEDIGLYRIYYFKKPVYTLRCNGYGCFETERVYALSIEKCIYRWNKHCFKMKHKYWECIGRIKR